MSTIKMPSRSSQQCCQSRYSLSNCLLLWLVEANDNYTPREHIPCWWSITKRKFRVLSCTRRNIIAWQRKKRCVNLVMQMQDELKRISKWSSILSQKNQIKTIQYIKRNVFPANALDLWAHYDHQSAYWFMIRYPDMHPHQLSRSGMCLIIF